MRILADTHVLLWWVSDNKQLGSNTRLIIESTRNEIYCSALSLSEMNLKQRIDKLRFTPGLLEELRQQSITTVTYGVHSAELMRDLPELGWKDPFDIMLIAQAISHDMVLLTADKKILRSNIPRLKTIDARK